MADATAPLLPELARSLRTLGRPRGAATEAAHAAVFAPLLDARARAAHGDAASAVGALRGAALAARIESLTRAAAAEGVTDPASARARSARAREALDPLRTELAALDLAAPDAAREGPASPAWQRWIDQLRRVFAAADVSCDALAMLLAERRETPPASGWLRRGPGGRA
jgi:hypothetical protein